MAEVVWVQRDAQGKIVGLFANKQPGFAEEQLPQGHADIIAFNNVISPKPLSEDEIDRLVAGLSDAKLGKAQRLFVKERLLVDPKFLNRL